MVAPCLMNSDGILEDFATDGTDRKDVFFYQVSTITFILEVPLSISGVPQMVICHLAF